MSTKSLYFIFFALEHEQSNVTESIGETISHMYISTNVLYMEGQY